MRQDQWKSQVLQEWDRWLQAQPMVPTSPTARDTLKFFCELQDRSSPLLDFRPGRRDKWQIIHAWLHHAGRGPESEHDAWPNDEIKPTARYGASWWRVLVFRF